MRCPDRAYSSTYLLHTDRRHHRSSLSPLNTQLFGPTYRPCGSLSPGLGQVMYFVSVVSNVISTVMSAIITSTSFLVHFTVLFLQVLYEPQYEPLFSRSAEPHGYTVVSPFHTSLMRRNYPIQSKAENHCSRKDRIPKRPADISRTP